MSIGDVMVNGYKEVICRESFLGCVGIEEASCADAVQVAVTECVTESLETSVELAVERGEEAVSAVEEPATAHGICFSEKIHEHIGIDTEREEQCLTDALTQYRGFRKRTYRDKRCMKSTPTEGEES